MFNRKQLMDLIAMTIASWVVAIMLMFAFFFFWTFTA